MKKAFIIVLCLVAIVLLLLSCIYLWKNHDYDLVDLSEINTDKDYINVTYDKEEDILKDDVLGILSIEKIGLKATVKEGSTSDVLTDYIGHISETSKYDGNIGLAAHNRLNKYSYFARINELEEGDILSYKTKFGTKEYKVNKKQVIYETDWKPLEDDGTNKLTLITCIADKRSQRLCIQAIEMSK